MSAVPKFSNLVDDVTARPAQRDGAPSGVYRPPKRDRQVMDTGLRKEKVDRRPMKSRTMEEFVTSELSTAPMAEPSIGTTIVQGGRRMKTTADREAEAERREYEETNYTRLPKESKKDKAKKARQAPRHPYGPFGPFSSRDKALKGLTRDVAITLNEERISKALHELAGPPPTVHRHSRVHKMSRPILCLGKTGNPHNAGRWFQMVRCIHVRLILVPIP